MTQDNTAANTDREIWRKHEGDYYSPSIYATAGGSIAINVGGHVITHSVEYWHHLAFAENAAQFYPAGAGSVTSPTPPTLFVFSKTPST